MLQSEAKKPARSLWEVDVIKAYDVDRKLDLSIETLRACLAELRRRAQGRSAQFEENRRSEPRVCTIPSALSLTVELSIAATFAGDSGGRPRDFATSTLE